MTPASSLYDQRGNRWQLDQELGSGGEGTVYRVVGEPKLAAKVFKGQSGKTADKLQAMLGIGTDDLRRLTAWPCGLLTEQHGGPIVGFLMPRFADARPIQNLYSPAQRKKWFPGAHWGFLLQAAASCADAFAVVHSRGCVVGDVNQGNALITPRGDVGLIDCDSFQISAGGHIYRCEVGVDLFTPPELQGKAFGQLIRTPNHDAFGLAVLLFHTLFVGRHPFIGVPDGQEDGDPADMIRQCRFAYSRSRKALRIDQPPHTPPLELVGRELAEMFERAFLADGKRPGGRPLPRQWSEALRRLSNSLQVCPANPGHLFPGHLGSCPWCAIRQNGGPDYFEGVAAAGAVFEFDQAGFRGFDRRFLKVAEHDYAALSVEIPLDHAIEPEALPEKVATSLAMSRVVGTVALLSPALVLFSTYSRVFLPIGLIAIAVFGLWWLGLRILSPLGAERRRRKDALDAAQKAFDDLARRIEDANVSASRAHRKLREEVARLRLAWERLPANYQDQQAVLERDHERLARNQFLREHFLALSEIPRIGPARKQTLLSFGVETAFDIDPRQIMRIKGFGQKLTEALVRWRDEVLSRFRFDPAAEIPREDRERVALSFRQTQDSFRVQLRAGIERLETEQQRLQQEIDPMRRKMDWARDSVAQASADLRLLTGRGVDRGRCP